MSRHIADKPADKTTSHRVEKFVKQDRKDIPSDATKELQRRPRDRAENKRVKEYTRIDRSQ